MMTYYHHILMKFHSAIHIRNISSRLQSNMFLKRNKIKPLFKLISKGRYIFAVNCLTFFDGEHLGLEIGAQIVIVERNCHLNGFFEQQVRKISIITTVIIIITTVIIIIK